MGVTSCMVNYEVSEMQTASHHLDVETGPEVLGYFSDIPIQYSHPALASIRIPSPLKASFTVLNGYRAWFRLPLRCVKTNREIVVKGVICVDIVKESLDRLSLLHVLTFLERESWRKSSLIGRANQRNN